MIGAIVGLIAGLAFFFFGMALLMQERQDRRKSALGHETSDALPVQETEPTGLEPPAQMVPSTEDGTQIGGTQGTYTRNYRRIKLGVQLLAQGIILLTVAIVCMIVDAFWLTLPWYVVLPVVVLFVIVGLVADAYTMGKSMDAQPSVDAIDDGEPQQEQQETQDCTRNEQDDD